MARARRTRRYVVTINPGALLGALLISGVFWYAIFHGFIALAGALK